MNLYDRALLFATAAHGEQKRKYTGEAYITHPIRVAAILRAIDAPDYVVAAALLHDVIEDTTVTADELRTEFGDDVTELVLEVTDTSKPTDGNRAARRAIDRAHLAEASYWGATIKLADLIDNTRDITSHDPKFAKLYLHEKDMLLDAMRNGHPGLRARAMEELK